uniref:UDP-N-acetylglucosamine--N-acetylmuramyl-(pentapeptide) pyrophosphoryl-undecaprenol N-acetylglucosamine transferase n=1 Tax=Magnetococcus massalia (strain MO-1) TaxID=451514 RepID=A0A1S7LK36_MAGMO|nr:GT28 : related to UDP-GlcNac:undecaprenyldiphospho-muramoylpentapeptide-b-N-acetylglucosaminyltransferase [Candidatus Magnetococcus massalia]
MRDTPNPTEAKRLLIAGGGTGGHLFPALAVAHAWQARHGEGSVHFIGGRRGLENRLVPEQGFSLETLPVGQLKGRGLLHKARTALGLMPVILKARSMLKQFAPHVVLGVGGYASAPAMVAARWLGIATALHEQNALPGLTNRLLSRASGRVFVSFPSLCNRFPGRSCSLTGNPVRQELTEVERLITPTQFGPDRPLKLLIFGGSQGASLFNSALPEALAPLAAERMQFAITQQVRDIEPEALQTRYGELGINAEVTPFIDDMAAAYSKADLVISRAGATTVAELAAAGRPALMIPYPYAADDHQAANADALAEVGGGWMVRQEQFDAAWLSNFLRQRYRDPNILQQAATQARTIAQPQAAETIVQALESMTRGVV